VLTYALNVDRALGFLGPVVAGLFLLTWLVAVVLILRARRSDNPRAKLWAFIPVAAGFALIGSVVVANGVSTSILRDDVTKRLAAAGGELLVDGSLAVHRDQLITDLRGLDNRPAHHSHPTDPVNLEIGTPSGPLFLTLQRDSSVTDEYWVFDRRRTTDNEVGRVTLQAGDLDVAVRSK